MKKGNISIFVPHLGCPNDCSFCDQRTISGRVTPPTPKQVTDQILSAVNHPSYAKYDLQVAFFGGSFTAIDTKYRNSLLEAAYPFVKSGQVSGIRISTRPDCIDSGDLAYLKSMGVTDIELGAQCMSDQVLKNNGRGHTTLDVKNACGLIKEQNIGLGLQMMCGLYTSSDALDLQTAGEFISLKPDCVRIYPTIVLGGTKLQTLYQQGLYTPPTLQSSVDLCTQLLKLFLQADIAVIRLGLHADQSLVNGMVAGPYHQAFRELCETNLYRQQLKKLILGRPCGTLQVQVHPSHISKLVGHKKQNKLWLDQQGYVLKPIPNENIPYFSIDCEE